MAQLHVVGLPHTQVTRAFATCAYTEKVRKFCTMMSARGYDVRLYAGEESEASCTEHIPCLTEAERRAAVGDRHYTEASFDAELPHWRAFNERAASAVRERLEPGDVVCVIGGRAHAPLAAALPTGTLVVEFGVGYSGTFADFRVWESYAWMHACYGASSGGDASRVDGRWYDEVIPGYADPADFPERTRKGGDYLLYVGRMIDRKGTAVAVEVAARSGRRLVMAGPGSPPAHPAVDYVGEVGPEQRGELMAGARALLAPTVYLEPFGNVAVEAQMCGTPVVTTDWGAFAETVVQGRTGFRCRTLGEFLLAVKSVGRLRVGVIRERANALYSLSAVGARYDAYFRRLDTLRGAGWYEESAGWTELYPWAPRRYSTSSGRPRSREPTAPATT